MRLKLTIFFLIVCVNLNRCDNSLYPDWVLLLNTLNAEHTTLNAAFKNKLSHISAGKLRLLDENIDDNVPLLENLNEYQNLNPDVIVVYLYVKDFYRHNYNDILNSNFTYAGDIGEESRLTVCRSVTNESNNLQTCQESTETQRKAKVISKNALNYPKLFDFVYNFNGEDDESLPLWDESLKIGVCGITTDNRRLKHYERELLRMDIKIQFESKCEDIKNNKMVALLAPEPFKTSERFITTTIFYDEQGMISPEAADTFPNSLPAVQSLDPLKHAFYKFMEERDWNRVAIITDDSLQSKEFEKGLTTLFDDKNVVYASMFCDTANCDFSKILRRLVMADARIVIANIEDEYLEALAREATKWKTQQKGFVWLFRSQQFANDIAPRTIGHIFSITLGPILADVFNAKRCLSEPCNLLATMNSVNQFLKNNYQKIKPEYLLNNSYHRLLASYIKSYLVGENIVKSYVNFHTRNGIEIVANMTIGHSKITNYTQHNVQLPYFRKELGDCLLKNEVYFKMCSDMELIFIMLVAAVFAMTTLGILFFFQMSQQSYSRMSC